MAVTISGSGTSSFSGSVSVSNTLSVSTSVSVNSIPVMLTGKQTIWIPASAMVAQTTNGAVAGTQQTTTNLIMLSSLDFDAATNEYAQFNVRMPKSWSEGTLSAYFLWGSTSAGSGDVVWGIQARAVSNDDAINGSWGTEVTVTDTKTATNDLMQSDETSAFTVGNTPVENDWILVRVYRDAVNASDTLAVDARLYGVVLLYTVDAGNDA